MKNEIIQKLEQQISKKLKIRDEYNDGVVDGLIIAIKIIENSNIID